MGRGAPVFGALVALLAAGGAQAKLVRYEIEGQRYSYSTNNREQAAAARERIEAARATADARAKAEAERAANPLARAFGSQAEREAAAADAKLRELLAASAAGEPSPVQRTRRPGPVRQVARAERKPTARPTAHAARAPAQEPVNTGSLAGRANPPAREATTLPKDRGVPVAPKVEAIVYDFASGIRTIHMADGSVDEDAFDRSMAPSLKRAQGAGGPRISFVNEGAQLSGAAAAPDANKP